ncbi:hypothetical protein RclHR1_06430014 [Rhizophagus clarus]|uniref:Ricin B lectin domain-containing protein n=1 Tax=Rhizophagus clarus TaxID=94130 RepID=A0A2Z6RY18_9GLOM|nr:hypothetical protein RclHR1_06430014 [Rhizophagus clarus]GES87292.1 hypothetical protein RCL_jg22161.t1 [Rhizophagus clarus]
MKFNLLLLILTTFTAVALSQQLPPSTYLIQSVITGGPWIENTGISLGQPDAHGSDWVVTELSSGNYLILDKSGKLAVQFEGVNKQVTLKPRNGSIAQEWIISSTESGIYICSGKVPIECITPYPTPNIVNLITSPKVPIALQMWEFIPANS